MTDDASSLISRLRDRGWSLAQLGAALDVHPHTVSHWASGQRPPRSYHMAAIMELLSRPSPSERRAQEKPVVQNIIRDLASKGWSYADIGRRVGSSPVVVRRWRDGMSLPHPIVRRMLEALLSEDPPPDIREVLLRLLQSQVKDGVYEGGMGEIAKLMGFDRAYVTRLMRQLAEAGRIVRLSVDEGAPSRWRILTEGPDDFRVRTRQLSF